MMNITKTLLQAVLVIGCAFSVAGCSSIMSHTGDNQGYYQGTRQNNEMIGDKQTGWTTKALALLDYPFSAVADTLLLPWDYYRQRDTTRRHSLHDQVTDSEKNHRTNQHPGHPDP